MERLPGTEFLEECDGSYWCHACLAFIDPIYISRGDNNPEPACEECLLTALIKEERQTFGTAECAAEPEPEGDDEIICQYPGDMSGVGLYTDTDDEDIGTKWYELGPSCMRVPAHQMKLLPSGDMT